MGSSERRFEGSSGSVFAKPKRRSQSRRTNRQDERETAVHRVCASMKAVSGVPVDETVGEIVLRWVPASFTCTSWQEKRGPIVPLLDFRRVAFDLTQRKRSSEDSETEGHTATRRLARAARNSGQCHHLQAGHYGQVVWLEFHSARLGYGSGQGSTPRACSQAVVRWLYEGRKSRMPEQRRQKLALRVSGHFLPNRCHEEPHV